MHRSAFVQHGIVPGESCANIPTQRQSSELRAHTRCSGLATQVIVVKPEHGNPQVLSPFQHEDLLTFDQLAPLNEIGALAIPKAWIRSRCAISPIAMTVALCAASSESR
jgi:hypothetical protein